MTDYAFLTVESIPQYIAARPALARLVDPEQIEQIDEIGDGNLNLVFRVRGADGNLILKQALPYVRMTGEGWPMTPERAAREAFSLARHRDVAGELVVDVIAYDPVQYVIAMEDLSDHRVWRDALNDGESHDGVAAAMGRYVAAVAVGTSVLGRDRTEVSEQIASTQNPDLCIITEDLVFTEPVADRGRNVISPGTEAAVAALARDARFASAMAEAKWRFMTHAEALIHGDLHTGSVMVRGHDGECASSVKAFDSEFAFYGPVAFDLGLLIANYAFAAARAFALGEAPRAAWILAQAQASVEAFDAEFRERATVSVDDPLWTAGFIASRLQSIHRETWLFAAAEMSRRIVGAARVRDIETLPEQLRARAIVGLLSAARELAAEWDAPHAPDEYAVVVGRAIEAAGQPASTTGDER